MPREKGVAGYVVEQRQTILVRQAAGDSRHFGELDALTGYQTRDLVAVPITHGRRLFGVMELMNLPDSMVFERYTVDQMEALGAALGERLAELTAGKPN